MSVADGPINSNPIGSLTNADVPTPYVDLHPAVQQELITLATYLGTTYQSIAKQIASEYAKCASQLDKCYTEVSNEILATHESQAQQYGGILQLLKQDVMASANTILSSVPPAVVAPAVVAQPMCEKTYPDPNEFNPPIPPMGQTDGYGIAQPTWEGTNLWNYISGTAHWGDQLSRYVYYNYKGQMVAGTILDCNANVRTTSSVYNLADYVCLTTNEQNPPPWIDDALEPIPEFTNLYITNNNYTIPSETNWQCPGGNGTGTGTGGGGIIVGFNPPPPPPPPPPTVCPPPVINIPECKTTILNQITVQPAPVIIGSPPNVVVEEKITTPPPTVIIEPIGGIEPITPIPPTWEPPTTDFVKQMLDAMGFPKDFIEWYGQILDDEELLETEDATGIEVI